MLKVVSAAQRVARCATWQGVTVSRETAPHFLPKVREGL